MSDIETCRRHVDSPRGDGDATPMAPRLTISYDLYRAIEDLRSVPVLRWPDQVTFDDNITTDVVDRTECNATTKNASVSGNVVQSELSNLAATTTTAMKVSATSSKRSCAVHTDDHNVSHRSATVDGGSSSTPLSVSLVDRPGWTVSKHIHASARDQSWSVEEQTSASEERVSEDSVFVDVATPIDADQLIDDVYEREMDQLDQLDIDLITLDDPPDWMNLPPESMAVDGIDQHIHRISKDSADIQTDMLLIGSSGDRRLIHPRRSNAAERNFLPADSAAEVHRAEVHPLSVRDNTSSSFTCRLTALSCIDTSAEQRFEEIVESMRDTVSEDDVDLDALADAENQFTVDSTNMKSGPGKLETTVGHRHLVTERFVDENMAPSVQPIMLASHCHSKVRDKQDTLEQKRQKDLTVCLASTLTECLSTLSQLDATTWRTDDIRHNTTNVGHYRKFDTANSDLVYSSSSTKSSRTNSLGRQNVTSSSSGFQSDLMDVDIDEEVDANVACDAADLGAQRSSAESTSLDSLLEENDDDGLYSHQTILRRPIPSPARRLDKHSIVNGFAEKPTIHLQTTVKTGIMCVTATDRTEGLQRAEDDKDDGTNKKNDTVMKYDEQSAKVEVLAEELITQEIVLNIILPQRSKRNKKRVDGCIDRMKSAESGVVDRRQSTGNTTPHRDFHIHRVVRCSDAADGSDDRRAISEYPESERQKSVTESEVVGKRSTVNKDDGQLDSSSAVIPCQSLVSRCIGGPVNIELERDAESSTTEHVDDDTRLRVFHRNRVKVLRVPDGSGGALFNAPVTSIRDVVNDVSRTLVGDHQLQPLPPGAHVTCDAMQRKSSTSLPDDDVTIIRRTIVDESGDN